MCIVIAVAGSCGRKLCQALLLPVLVSLLFTVVIYSSFLLHIRHKSLLSAFKVSDKLSITGLCLCGLQAQMCGPLWGQKCGNQDFHPGICARISPLFQPGPAFSPAVQSKTGVWSYRPRPHFSPCQKSLNHHSGVQPVMMFC